MLFCKIKSTAIAKVTHHRALPSTPCSSLKLKLNFASTATYRASHFVVITLLLLLTGCQPSNPQSATGLSTEETIPSLQPITQQEVRSFDSIKDSGTLRVLQPKWENSRYLARQGMPGDHYRDLISLFAKERKLNVEWLPVEHFGELIPQLNSGGGDIIVTNLTHTKSRAKQIDFTAPLTQIEEVLVVNQAYGEIRTIDEFINQNLTLTIPSNSSFIETAKSLLHSFPNLVIDVLPSTVEPEDIIDAIVDNPKIASIMDSNTVDILSDYRQGFKAIIPVSPKRNIAWAIRQGDESLLKALNKFITINAFKSERKRPQYGDWAVIKQRKSLRVLTRNHPANYFIWRGELRGFDFDLLKRFADQNQLNLEMIVAPTEDDILLSLLNGKADLAAATLAITPERKALGIEFTQPVNRVGQILIANSTNPIEASSFDRFNNATITVHRHSSYWSLLKGLIQANPDNGIAIQAAPDSASSIELIDWVADGDIEYSVADSHVLAIEQNYRNSVKSVMTVGESVPIAWATRKQDSDLLHQLNKFIEKEDRSLFFNLTYAKYFQNRKRTLRSYEGTLKNEGGLSPWDDLVKKHASVYGFDWRMIVAQMYQESLFDPNAVSYAGAVGLMQVLPRTARELGFENLKDPATSIEAGIAYLAWVQERFPETLPVEERIRFALASYNAGYGHVYDARRLARRLGLNPDRWFDNVETAIKLLSKPEYYQKSRFGYCRGSEPANYVRKIESLYHAYLENTITT